MLPFQAPGCACNQQAVLTSPLRGWIGIFVLSSSLEACDSRQPPSLAASQPPFLGVPSAEKKSGLLNLQNPC